MEEEKGKDLEPDFEFVEDGIDEDSANARIKALKKELKEYKKQTAEYLSGWQRAKADFVNSRREEEKNREIFAKFANERLLEEVIRIADSLELASNADEDNQTASLKKGIDQTYHQLLQIMRGYGVVFIEAVGLPFNPEEHESIAEEEVDDLEKDQMVLAEIQRGYKMHDKVLRPTKVKIGVYKKV